MAAYRHVRKHIPIGRIPVLSAGAGVLLAGGLSRVWVPEGSFGLSRTMARPLALAGAVVGALVGFGLALLLDALRPRLWGWRLRRRWRNARCVGLDRAVGPVEVEGRVTVRTPVMSRVGRAPCAAYLTHIELSDGTVEAYSEVGALEVHDASGGVAEVAAGPCAIALLPRAGTHELLLLPGDRVRLRAIGRRISGQRVALEGDGDRLLTLVAIEPAAVPGRE